MALVNLRKMYRVDTALVAAYDPSTEQWDTAVAVPNLKGLQINPVHTTDNFMVYGAEEDGLSVLTACEIVMDFSGYDVPSANEMTGQTSTTAGSGDTEVRTTRNVAGSALHHFGLSARIVAKEGGDAHILVPFMYLPSLMALNMAESNKFVVPSITARAQRLRLSDDSLYPIWDQVEHAVVTALETDFNTAFTALS